jgi:hypothetical protein
MKYSERWMMVKEPSGIWAAEKGNHIYYTNFGFGDNRYYHKGS